MRKFLLIIAITLCLFLTGNISFADWEQKNPLILGSPLEGRGYSGIASIGNGRFLLFGGLKGYDTNSTNFLKDTWIYEINKDRWVKMTPTFIGGSMAGRAGFGIANLDPVSIIIYGGYTRGSYSAYSLSETWIYFYNTNTWTKKSPTVIGASLTARRMHKMCHIEEGKVLMFGGVGDNTSTYNNETWIYDFSQNQWQFMQPTIVGEDFHQRAHFGLAYIGNGKVLMFGGEKTSVYYNDTWIYDIALNQWTKMTPTIEGGALTPRSKCELVSIGGGQALLFGGGSTNEFWLYDSSENKWSNLTNLGSGDIPSPRNAMALSSAGLGKALMFGGEYTLSDTWLFSLDNNIANSVGWEIVPTGVELSWSMPEAYFGTEFSIFRDGIMISQGLSQGLIENGIIHFTFLDENTAANRIYRYKLVEYNPDMNSEIYYPEIGVPYCP